MAIDDALRVDDCARAQTLLDSYERDFESQDRVLWLRVRVSEECARIHLQRRDYITALRHAAFVRRNTPGHPGAREIIDRIVAQVADLVKSKQCNAARELVDALGVQGEHHAGQEASSLLREGCADSPTATPTKVPPRRQPTASVTPTLTDSATPAGTATPTPTPTNLPPWKPAGFVDCKERSASASSGTGRDLVITNKGPHNFYLLVHQPGQTPEDLSRRIPSGQTEAMALQPSDVASPPTEVRIYDCRAPGSCWDDGFADCCWSGMIDRTQRLQVELDKCER